VDRPAEWLRVEVIAVPCCVKPRSGWQAVLLPGGGDALSGYIYPQVVLADLQKISSDKAARRWHSHRWRAGTSEGSAPLAPRRNESLSRAFWFAQRGRLVGQSGDRPGGQRGAWSVPWRGGRQGTLAVAKLPDVRAITCRVAALRRSKGRPRPAPEGHDARPASVLPAFHAV